MLKKTASAALCLACAWAITPAMAAQKEMPQGKRDQMSMKDTKHEITAQHKENKEANKNVDRLIKNRE